MSNIIYISSILAAIIWGFCFVLIEISPAAHIVLIMAFIGTGFSIYLDEKKNITKQKSSI